jgi:hypothetical protein
MALGPTMPLGDIAHVIQLAIAPVFLLTAVGTLLMVLTNRLGRAVDRRRLLVARGPGLEAPVAAQAAEELGYLDRRVRIIYVAIALAVLCALLICILIAMAFVDAFLPMDFGRIIAVFFVLAMLALIGTLACFLREIFLAVSAERCPIV